jgi:hypothetical protein
MWPPHTAVRLDVLGRPQGRPQAAAPCLLIGAATLPHHSRAKKVLLKNEFSNLLPIRDRPSTLTSYSICDQQHILTLPTRVS